MSANKTLIENFYRAFQLRDAAQMASSYHPEARFSDPAFSLEGEMIGEMWHMLCHRGKDLKLEFEVTEDASGKVSAHWEAHYTFSQTGRRVHNIIDADFEFKDGRIISHHDHFDFWRWSRQALGPAGLLLGWSNFLQKQVQERAMQSLDHYINAKQRLTD